MGIIRSVSKTAKQKCLKIIRRLKQSSLCKRTLGLAWLSCCRYTFIYFFTENANPDYTSTYFKVFFYNYSVVTSCFIGWTTQDFVYLIVKCYQNNSRYGGWIKAIKAQALLKAPTHPHKNEEESEGLGTSSSLILIGYTRISCIAACGWWNWCTLLRMLAHSY